MRMKSQSVLMCCVLLSLFLASLPAGVGLAQSATPLADLNIALWPEYDRPEVLVIFRGQVADDVALPAPVSFTLPASVPALNAVAYLDEAQGGLLNLPDYEFIEGTAGNVLSFATPSRQFQFEYYSSDALSINGTLRNLSFSFTPSTDVAHLTFELQQPTTTQAFRSDPPPSTTQVKQDGLTYALYEVGAVSAGDSRSLQVSYTRSTDELSVNALGGVSIPTSPEQTPVEIGGGGLKDSLGPILIVAGVLLLAGALTYWTLSQRAVVVPEPAPRQASARPRQPSRKGRPGVPESTRPPATTERLASFCHRCGTKFRDDARFCHACGAERRAE